MDTRQTESRPNWRRRAKSAAALVCWGYAAACLVAFLVIRFAAERWWPATLLLFAPRWVWATPLLIALPAALAYRRKLLWLPLATGVLSLFLLLGFCVPWRTWHPHRPPQVSLRILTCNAHARQMANETVDELLSRYKPDIVLIQDFWPLRTPQSLRQPGWFSHRHDELFIASRYPIEHVEDLGIHAADPDDESMLSVPRRGTAADYTIELPTGTITLVNLHLASAHRGLSAMKEDAELSGAMLARNSVRRREESQMIRNRIDQIGGPVILAGDFNTPDDSPLFRTSWAGLQDAFTTAGWGFGVTYAKHRTALRIDHVLCDTSWTIRSCQVGRDVGSGHHALVADLER